MGALVPTLPLRASIGRWSDIAYSATRHAKRRLDIASPSSALLPGARRLPVCVFVHGGSWQRGDKRESVLNRDIDRAFAARGCVGVSVNYRLSPEVQHPEHALDVATALHWLRTNIDKVSGGDVVVTNGTRVSSISPRSHATSTEVIRSGSCSLGTVLARTCCSCCSQTHSFSAPSAKRTTQPRSYVEQWGSRASTTLCDWRTRQSTARLWYVALSYRMGESVVGSGEKALALVWLPPASACSWPQATPTFGERADQWREASVTSAVTKEGRKSPLARTPLLLLTAEDDFHFNEDADELATWLRAAGSVRCVPSCRFHRVYCCACGVDSHARSCSLCLITPTDLCRAQGDYGSAPLFNPASAHREQQRGRGHGAHRRVHPACRRAT